MRDARRAALLLLLANLTVKLQQCQAQWRPSYQPTSAVYNIHNDTFTITLAYNQWQGYFLNTYTVPAGGHFSIAHACSCMSSFMLCAQRLPRGCAYCQMHGSSSSAQQGLRHSHAQERKHRLSAVRTQATAYSTPRATSHGTWAMTSSSPWRPPRLQMSTAHVCSAHHMPCL